MSSKFNQNNSKSFAVIGMACRFPGAKNLRQFWSNLINQVNSVAEVTRFDLSQYYSSNFNESGKTYCKWGAFLDDIDTFDAHFFSIPPKQAEAMDPNQRLLLEIVWKALEHSGYAGIKSKGTKTGVFVGCSNNQYLFLSNHSLASQQDGLDNSNAGIANRISYFMDFRGPSVTIDTTCSSSLMAIHSACQSIQLKESQMAIACGVNIVLLPEYFVTMSQMKLLSPQAKHIILDRNTKGFIPGEGVAAIIIKSLEKAIVDNDTIYAVIKGSASNYSGKTTHISVPAYQAEAEVIRSAIEKSTINPESISFIELSGAGSLLGDTAEINGLKEVFQHITDNKKIGWIGSVKTNIGNLEAASGIAGFIKVVLSLNKKLIPGILHFEKPNRHLLLDNLPFQIAKKNIDWHVPGKFPLRAGISSFGVGGTNVHVICEEYIEAKKQFLVSTELKFQDIITLSAKTSETLYTLASKLRDIQKEDYTIKNIAYTLNTGREHFVYRLAIIVKDIKELDRKLSDFLSKKHSDWNSGIVYEDWESGIFYAKFNKDEVSKSRKNPLQHIYQPYIKEIDRFVSIPSGLYKYSAFLYCIANAYVKGEPINWITFYEKKNCNILDLPSYPFQNRKYWINITNKKYPVSQNITASKPLPPIKKNNITQEIIHIFINQMIQQKGFSQYEIDPNHSLSDYGLDSIFIMNTIQLIEQLTNIHIDHALIFDCVTIHQIAALFGNYYKTNNQKSDLKVTSACKTSAEEMNVAVVGMAGVFPGAKNINEFWINLKNGVDSVTEIPKERFNSTAKTFSHEEISTKYGGFIDGFDCFDASVFNIHRKAAEYMDPQHRHFLEQVWTAFEHAGYSKKCLSSIKTGVFVGLSSQEYAWHILKNNIRLNHHTGTGTARSLLANRISHFFNLRGPSLTVDTACSSSLTAIHLACNSIVSGESDLAVAGGVNLAFDKSTFLIFNRAGVLSKTGKCKVFDRSADGYVRGEGVGVVILKSLNNAIKDNDSIYAIIKKSVINHNGENFSITSPSLKAQVELFEKAYCDIDPETISYMEAGSTGTKPEVDSIEIRALSSVFNKYTDKTSFCTIGSVKTNVGHLEAASGICGLIKVILSMNQKKIPPMLNYSTPGKTLYLEKSPFSINKTTKDWNNSKLRAGLTNFGFGGTNAHVIIEGPPEREVHFDNEDDHCVFAFSASTPDSLNKILHNYKIYLSSPTINYRLSDVCYTLNVGRNHFKYYRLAIAANTKNKLLTKINLAKTENTKIEKKKIVFSFSRLGNNDSLEMARLLAQWGIKPDIIIIFNQNGSYVNVKSAFSSLGKNVYYQDKDNIKDILSKDAFIIVEFSRENNICNDINANNKNIYLECSHAIQYKKETAVLLADLYNAGINIDWHSYFNNKKQIRIALPSYPFNRQKYWLK